MTTTKPAHSGKSIQANEQALSQLGPLELAFFMLRGELDAKITTERMRDLAIVALISYAGVRSAEIPAIQYNATTQERLNLDRHLLIPGKYRRFVDTTPVGTALDDYLQLRHRPDGDLFLDKIGNPICESTVHEIIARYARSFSRKKVVTAETLLGAFIHRCRQKGMTSEAIDALMNGRLHKFPKEIRLRQTAGKHPKSRR